MSTRDDKARGIVSILCGVAATSEYLIGETLFVAVFLISLNVIMYGVSTLAGVEPSQSVGRIYKMIHALQGMDMSIIRAIGEMSGVDMKSKMEQHEEKVH